MNRRIPSLILCAILSGGAGVAIGYEYAKFEIREAFSNSLESYGAYEVPSGEQYVESEVAAQANAPSFGCIELGEPQIVDERLIFGITNTCAVEISYVDWNVNIYRSDESKIFDTESLRVFDIPPSGYKQEKLLADLPEGEFSWEALPDSIR